MNSEGRIGFKIGCDDTWVTKGARGEYFSRGDDGAGKERETSVGCVDRLKPLHVGLQLGSMQVEEKRS